MPGMRCERGQATVEWVGIVLLISLILGALAAAPPRTGGRSFGRLLSERIFCAVGANGCREAGAAGGLADRAGAAMSPSEAPGSGALAVRMSAVGPCTAYSCNPVRTHCDAVHEGKRGRAYCRARAAAEGPSGLTKFLRSRFKGCLIGAAGAKAFTPFAEELLRKEATRSAKNALRAVRKGLRRAKDSLMKGKVKPGLVGCLGGTIGL